VIAIWNNPEFIRNFRAQLRPGRAIATAVICAAVSIVIGFAISHQTQNARPTGPYGWGLQVLQTAFWLQALMLAAGGGIACINSIYREKDQNTLDYQRVTRLTPLELALGKLFGAPVFTYFVFLCLMPLAIFGAVQGKRPFLTVVAAYAVLLVATVTIHALALLISLLTVRGSHTGAILLLLVLLGGTAGSGGGSHIFHTHPFGPFYAAEVVSWDALGSPSSQAPFSRLESHWSIDVFFGKEVLHVPLLLAIDLLFGVWFMLALVRNIKRDPNYYEICSPLQALGFAVYLNLLFVAFFNWQSGPPVDNQAILLSLNIFVFFSIGLSALRNRERVRRILRTEKTDANRWLGTAWPAPLMIAGTLAIGFLTVLGVAEGRDPRLEWNANFAVLRTLFFVAWITRDMQFLQWMNLRRGKHPLVMGVLFLVVFYVCVSILMASLGVYSRPERTPFSAFFVPSAIYVLDHSAWALRPAIWLAAFIAQWVLVAVFIALQRQSIEELQSSATAPAAAPIPAQT
jgi:hypothetical protein